jgi:hypothetical protein
MVSDVTSPLFLEEWSYVDGLDPSTLCRHDVATTASPQETDPADNQSDAPIPYVLHYCQDYGVGHWFFSKYHFPPSFLSCEHPLFRIPPANVAESALAASNHSSSFVVPGDGKNVTFTRPVETIRNAFAACAILRAINAASSHFKGRHCPSENANLNETFTFHSADKFPPL